VVVAGSVAISAAKVEAVADDSIDAPVVSSEAKVEAVPSLSPSDVPTSSNAPSDAPVVGAGSLAISAAKVEAVVDDSIDAPVVSSEAKVEAVVDDPIDATTDAPIVVSSAAQVEDEEDSQTRMADTLLESEEVADVTEDAKEDAPLAESLARVSENLAAITEAQELQLQKMEDRDELRMELLSQAEKDVHEIEIRK
jgi:hypothetical protein